MESEFVPSAVTIAPKAEAIIKKVPGKILPIPTEEITSVAKLSKKTGFDLRELLDRQNKILSNKLLVNKLPDKGRRAKELKSRIEHELKSRDEVNNAASLFSEMKLGQLNALEWTGHCNPGQMKCKASIILNPFHEETNPLKIMASHSGTMAQNKQIRFVTPEESLIKPDDLIESSDSNSGTNETSISLINRSLELSMSSICSNQNGHQNAQKIDDHHSANKSSPPCLQACLTPQTSTFDEPEPFAHSICERFGQRESKERFKLNKPLKPFSGTFSVEPTGRISSKPRKWMETNVTPPPLIHNNAKLLSLEESLEVQCKQNQQLKEIQMKHAAERLSNLHGIRMSGEDIQSSIVGSKAYRHYKSSDSDSAEEVNEAELEDQELHDEDQLDRGTTVVYSVES